MKKNTPKFSIVIPTRDRNDTLAHCIRTCLKSYPFDVEVLVFDNSQYDGAKEVIDSIGHSHGNTQIRYVAATSNLAMSRSWETAVSIAEGEYITVIGDDDGLLPDSLVLVNNLVDRFSSDLIRFAQASYGWPKYPLEQWRNRLQIPLAQTVKSINGPWVSNQVARFLLSYHCLPMIYNSFVSKKFIHSIRKRLGSVFHSSSPDVGSGFLFAQLSKTYLSCSVPVSIAGGSHRSNGAIELMSNRRNPGISESNGSDFWSMNEQQGIVWPSLLPKVRVLPIAIAESLAIVNHVVGKGLNLNPMPVSELVRRSIDSLVSFPSSNQSIDMQKLHEFAAQHRAPAITVSESRSKSINVCPFNIVKHSLSLNVEGLGVHNVYDASEFISRFFRHDLIAETITAKSYIQSVASKARRLFTDSLYHNRPRSWEFDA
jgi:hypothetical protein